jgi:GH43 family beta-xylosidase
VGEVSGKIIAVLTSDIQIRDPFVLPHNGRYYLYGTTDTDAWKSHGVGFNAYISGDLANWEGPIPVFRPPSGFWGQKNFWAPEVYVYGGAFYMFASFIGENAKRGTAILKAERPEGPFLPWSSGAVTPADCMCLDGTLFIDEKAAPWIVYCHEWVQIGDGTICAAQLDKTLQKRVSEPVTLLASSEAPWSRQAYSPSNNMRGYVTDGCFMHRTADGKLLMIWSCMGENGYCLGYALSETGSVTGPWRQAKKPLFTDDGGHGMIFKSYENHLLLTLHRPNKSPDERAVVGVVLSNVKYLLYLLPCIIHW